LFTFVGILLIPFWIAFGLYFTSRYLERMECTLTDMGMVQGPVRRALELRKLSLETAGQSGPGSLVALTGIVDAEEFREAVLKQRDILPSKAFRQSSESIPADSSQPSQIALLTEIRDSLRRLEDNLG
jgi:putative membrane protein